MSQRHLTPGGRGFLMVNAHPTGAATTVDQLWEQIPGRAPAAQRPVVLVIGFSAGYGLAATLAAVRRGAVGVGVAFEAPETERRTASAGWYRTARAAELTGVFTFLNTDAFADSAKAEVVKLLAERYGKVDHLIYSIAAPRRTDPETGQVYHSVIQPLDGAYTAKTLEFGTDGPAIGSSTLQPATAPEREETVKVMGGEDWQRWVDALDQAHLLAEDFTTAALTYVGSDLTAAIYRAGTIGAAKEHLEATARQLDERLGSKRRAYTVVAGAAVTQASTAIPSIALYTSLLHKVLGDDGFQSTAQQMTALWQQLDGEQELVLDETGRIRLDGWELDPAVQDQVRALWDAVTTENVADSADTVWFRRQVGQLYGWDVPGVDYAVPVETTVPWPTGQR
ncbi:enoyl-[acyl-carrier protein] reductase/trans-2-enoyl-CoA reductase (NAD+) [Streptacidiphilus sp. MAP12-20]|uniref:enoyl-[acyl-carrier-protein] reductase FabV n=1 Tax=Streptacidiphilus sp. MAP12-20 TaxID=3156299 RepID=UPI0035185977